MMLLPNTYLCKVSGPGMSHHNPALTVTMEKHRMADNGTSARKARKSTARKHGHAFTGMISREYRIWENMRQRCLNPKASHYARYGGRGISICERWNDFALFYADMGPCPTQKHSIDRIDNDGGYEPENCRWVTQTEQMRNSSRIKLIEYRGEQVPVSHAIRQSCVSPQTFYRRIAEGWTVEKALTAPPYAKRRNA